MKIILMYASMSGNTEEMAEIIQGRLSSQEVDVSMFQIDMDDIEVADMLKYDAVIFGTYTWGDGDVPYELEDLYDDMESVNLTGLPVGLFGSCDSMYPAYGGAIDKFQERFKACGADVVVEPLKVELTPDSEDAERCSQFAENFKSQIHVKIK
ncbi:flavodoxin [Halobacillus sp. A1]|uniref:flavodoxin n=1 Tax=Halobacillus sp. A1 TaxID=2880262 RepID=UPI002115A40B|nr:flavodoxin [Halobacillus sp. A1]